MASICCSPPESVPPGCASPLPEDGEQVEDALEVGLEVLARREKAPISRFSLTDMRGKILRPSGAWERPRVTTS